MSYTPTNWSTGDPITATKLNKMEQGIADGGGGALICTCAYNQALARNALDKTVAEIYDAYMAGTPIFIRYIYGTGYDQYESYQFMMPVVELHNYAYQSIIKIIATRAKRETVSSVWYSYTPAVMIFQASSASDYPTYDRTIYATASSVSGINALDA